MNFSIAIDGPAGAGKSTIARLVAIKFNLMYINTGAMYRAVTYKAIENDISYNDKKDLVSLIEGLEMHFENDDLIVNGENFRDILSSPLISNNVSNFAAISEVREKLVMLQKKMAERYSVVMDGRDIGTVVLKDAPIKFYLTASSEERANRRFTELSDKGLKVNFEEILSDIVKRDYIDSHRETSPLIKAEDAIEIDSSYLTIEEVVEKMSEYISSYLKN